jgi:hypothetical protein
VAIGAEPVYFSGKNLLLIGEKVSFIIFARRVVEKEK